MSAPFALNVLTVTSNLLRNAGAHALPATDGLDPGLNSCQHITGLSVPQYSIMAVINFVAIINFSMLTWRYPQSYPSSRSPKLMLSAHDALTLHSVSKKPLTQLSGFLCNNYMIMCQQLCKMIFQPLCCTPIVYQH